MAFQATGDQPDHLVERSGVAAAEPPVLQLERVTKRLDGREVLNDLSLAVPRRTLFALIGPSGSGKSTTVRLACGIYKPDSGTVRLLGYARAPWPRAVRARIGYMPQGDSLYPRLTISENLRYAGAVRGMARAAIHARLAELLRLVDLDAQRTQQAGRLSGGQRRRLALAIALVDDPEVLFVDEPTAGLDPALRARLWAHFRSLTGRGHTVVITTQHIDEAELTDQVAVLRGGRLVAHGSPAALAREAFGGDVVLVQSADLTAKAARAVEQIAGVQSVRFADLETLEVVSERGEQAVPRILTVLAEEGCVVRSIGPRRPRFEEVFLRLTGVAPVPESAATSGASAADAPADATTEVRHGGA
jgi:ABC-2 type transport system ATP-binding protein